MLDRESSFADDDVIELLRERYVPVALDVWYESRREDPAGDYFRKVVHQREGLQPEQTTQGLYIFGPDGTLISGWNNRDPGKLRDRLRRGLDGYAPALKKGAKAGKAERGSEDGDERREDPRYSPELPEGGLVLSVHSRIVKAQWPDAGDEYEKVVRAATGLDHLWVTKQEVEDVARGEFPQSLATRIARFHCIDNTRGEPPMWEKAEVGAARIEMKAEKAGRTLEGEIRLLAAGGDRGFDARAFGKVERKGEQITRLDLVVRGEFFGEGTYTQGAPPGKFTLVIVFTLARPEAGEGAGAGVPPQGAHWLDDYLGRV